MFFSNLNLIAREDIRELPIAKEYGYSINQEFMKKETKITNLHRLPYTKEFCIPIVRILDK